MSGGQRQRVAVGRAIVRKPKVFLFDEPLSNLDAKLRVLMRTELSKLHNQLEATMIYVTHDQIEAMTMADRIVVMSAGIIQQIGEPLELYKNPANRFVAGFIGSPAMNFIDMEISRDNNSKVLSDENLMIRIPDYVCSHLELNSSKTVCFGIRPEDLLFKKPVDNESYIKAEVEVIEPLGDETHLYMKGGRHKFLARISSDIKVSTGDTLYFVPEMGKAVSLTLKQRKP